MMALAFAAPRVSGFLPQVSAVHGMAFRTARTVLYPSLIIFWHVFVFNSIFLISLFAELCFPWFNGMPGEQTMCCPLEPLEPWKPWNPETVGPWYPGTLEP